MPLNYQRDYPDGMSAPNDPTKLLLPLDVDDWRKGVLIPLYFGSAAFLYPLLKNFATNLPLHTGIYRYPLSFLVGAALGKVFDDYRESQLALRDAHYRQYIRDHPQDFEPQERKKVGDLFKEWTPIR
uniref:NADH dehydrogenase [ubiquinone] 1 subunit C2 n=1 Tax=Cacopsylla melanoneura TaxID=428564 RepID=A0A8D8S8T3_9HEMI